MEVHAPRSILHPSASLVELVLFFMRFYCWLVRKLCDPPPLVKKMCEIPGDYCWLIRKLCEIPSDYRWLIRKVGEILGDYRWLIRKLCEMLGDYRWLVRKLGEILSWPLFATRGHPLAYVAPHGPLGA